MYNKLLSTSVICALLGASSMIFGMEGESYFTLGINNQITIHKKEKNTPNELAVLSTLLDNNKQTKSDPVALFYTNKNKPLHSPDLKLFAMRDVEQKAILDVLLALEKNFKMIIIHPDARQRLESAIPLYRNQEASAKATLSNNNDNIGDLDDCLSLEKDRNPDYISLTQYITEEKQDNDTQAALDMLNSVHANKITLDDSNPDSENNNSNNKQYYIIGCGISIAAIIAIAYLAYSDKFSQSLQSFKNLLSLDTFIAHK